jgi:hypothetical protein
MKSQWVLLAAASLMAWGSSGVGVAQETRSRSRLVGTWISGQGASGRPLTLTIQTDGRFEAEFKDDATAEVVGYLDVSNGQLMIRDENGPSACLAADGPGVYSFVLKGGELTIKVIKDDKCPGRRNGLQRTWTKK